MAAYGQRYAAGKRRAAKKMTRDQKQKLYEARRKIAIQDGAAHNFSLCKRCAYYYELRCTFDGSSEPAMTECREFVRRPG